MPRFTVTLDHKPIEASSTVTVEANGEKHAYELACRELRKELLSRVAEMSIWAVKYERGEA